MTVTHHGPVVLGDPASGHAVAAPLHGDGRAEPDVRRPPPDAASLVGGRARGGDAAVGRSRQQPRVRRRPRRHRLPDARASCRSARRRTRGYRSRAGTAPTKWTGAIPFEEMPALRDPAAGWIATANSRIVDAGYPHYLGLDYASDFRTRAHRGAPPGSSTARRWPTWPPSTRTASSIPARALMELTEPDRAARRRLSRGPRDPPALGRHHGRRQRGGGHLRGVQRAPRPATSCTRCLGPARLGRLRERYRTRPSSTWRAFAAALADWIREDDRPFWRRATTGAA